MTGCCIASPASAVLHVNTLRILSQIPGVGAALTDYWVNRLSGMVCHLLKQWGCPVLVRRPVLLKHAVQLGL